MLAEPRPEPKYGGCEDPQPRRQPLALVTTWEKTGSDTHGGSDKRPLIAIVNRRVVILPLSDKASDAGRNTFRDLLRHCNRIHTLH